LMKHVDTTHPGLPMPGRVPARREWTHGDAIVVFQGKH
jgi:hypothetical protein